MINNFYQKQLSKLLDGKIIGTIQDEDGEFFGLRILMPKGKVKLLWFLSDDEGNGPGSFEIGDEQ